MTYSTLFADNASAGSGEAKAALLCPEVPETALLYFRTGGSTCPLSLEALGCYGSI